MKNIKYHRSVNVKLFAILLTFTTASGFMFGIKTSLSKEWQKRFSSVIEFNSYAEKNEIKIDDSKLKDIKIVGAKFSNAKFNNTDWENVTFFESEIKNAHFKDGEYRKAAFQKSVIENTIFEGITFYSADFEAATLKNVKFVKCNFGRANFQYLENSNVVFENAVLEEVVFYDSDVDVKYLNSKLTEVEMMGTTAKEHFIVKGSDIYDVNLGNSSIPYIEITDSTVKKTTFSSGKANKLVMKNLKGAMQASGAIIDEIIIDEINTEVLLFAGTHSKSIKVSNVTVTDSFNADAVADFLEITDSNIKSIWNGGSKLETFRIINTELRGTRNESSKIVTFHLENVTLNGIFNFEYTHAENLELINITKGPNYEFLGEGGNIKF